MGVPLYTVNTNEYAKMLQQELFNGNMFVESIEIDGKNCLCMFSCVSNFEYIFWKQNSSGNIYLEVLNNKTKDIQFVRGSLTRIGRIFCESSNQKKSIVEYFNDLIMD